MYYQCFPSRGKARKDSKTFLFKQYFGAIILKISAKRVLVMIPFDGKVKNN